MRGHWRHHELEEPHELGVEFDDVADRLCLPGRLAGIGRRRRVERGVLEDRDGDLRDAEAANAAERALAVAIPAAAGARVVAGGIGKGPGGVRIRRGSRWRRRRRSACRSGVWTGGTRSAQREADASTPSLITSISPWQVIPPIGAEGLSRRPPAGSCRLFLGPGFRLGARWNRLGETVKTRKKRNKTGKKWTRYGLKRVNKEGRGGITCSPAPTA